MKAKREDRLEGAATGRREEWQPPVIRRIPTSVAEGQTVVTPDASEATS